MIPRVRPGLPFLYRRRSRRRFAPGAGKGNDQIVQHGGKQVLRIAGAVSQRLNGSTMDVVVVEEPEGTRMGIGIMPPDPEPLTDGS